MITTVEPISIGAYDTAQRDHRENNAARLADLLALTLTRMRADAHALLLPTEDVLPVFEAPGDPARPLVLDRGHNVVLRIAHRHLPRVTDPDLFELWRPLSPEDPDAHLAVIDALRREGALLPRYAGLAGREWLPLSEEAVKEAGGRRVRWADPYARHLAPDGFAAEEARFQVAADALARLLADTLRAIHPAAHYLVFSLEHRLGEDRADIDLAYMLGADGRLVQDMDMPNDPTPGPLPEHLRAAWGRPPGYEDFVETIRQLHGRGFLFDELPRAEHRLPQAPRGADYMYCLRLTPHALAAHFHGRRSAGTRYRRLQPYPPALG
ncbi:hypothetical protein ACFZBU_42155 [Embleya sp. NPDC008237]|uniref:hypothetical protein n=1 Tax=Embleya sp. NPDC008237 TaxID=3363978 RepID=UPI0036E24CA1